VSDGDVTLAARFAAAFVLLLPVLACKREPAPTFGEPTGVQLSVDGTNVQLAIATSGGGGVTSSVNTVASGFHGALKACPAAVAFLKGGQGLRIQFKVQDGKVVAPDPLPKEAPVACVLTTLHGKSLFVAGDAGTPSHDSYSVMAEMRQGP
jgi:hypothetical protein